MIVPMKKIHLIVQKKDIISALEELRNLGTVHVEPQEELSGYQLEERREEVEILTKAIGILKGLKPPSPAAQEDAPDWTEVVNGVLELSAQIEHYKESAAKREVQIKQWEPWGDFDPKDLEELAVRGIYVRLGEVPAAQKFEVPAGVILETISLSGGIHRCLAISKDKGELPFETVLPPAMGFAKMKALQEEEERKRNEAGRKIAAQVCYLDSLERTLIERKNVLSFEEVEKGMRAQEELALLKGYCPASACGNLQKMAHEEDWGLLIEAPGEGDAIPTLLRNPKWVELIKPVFTMINIIPGYKEVDISFFFLIFFAMFFGILIGDAGYGTLFLLATLWVHRSAGKKMADKKPFFLMYVLSGCAVLWGLGTGTLFGQILFKAAVKPVLPWLADNKNVQRLCFLIGVVHLTIAHGWRFLMKLPAVISALAEIGWIVILWGAFFLANAMVVGAPLFGLDMGKSCGIVLVGAVLVVIDIISRPKDGLFTGLVLSFFGCISAFTDVVSYIRLFAVGLAGVAVADAFNQMALDVGFHNVAAGLGAALILVFGHILNITLCMMGVLVHGIRLNVLEFASHLNMEWSGIKYQPFGRMRG